MVCCGHGGRVYPKLLTRDGGGDSAKPAPMAFFPFSGWKESFFGDLHGQGRHAVEFYTETKVVIESWPSRS